MRVTQCGEDEGFAIHLCDFVPPTAGFVSTMHACMPWQWSRVYDGCGPECAVVLSHRPVPDSMFNDFPLFVHIYIYGVIYVVPAFLEWCASPLLCSGSCPLYMFSDNFVSIMHDP